MVDLNFLECGNGSTVWKDSVGDVNVDVKEFVGGVYLDSAMAGASEEGGGVEEAAPAAAAAEVRKRGLSGSMSLRTRKLGRRLSRSMSIVALKLPEKAQSITRSSSKLMRAGRDKKTRSFELSIILPDKTQKQVIRTVWNHYYFYEYLSYTRKYLNKMNK